MEPDDSNMIQPLDFPQGKEAFTPNVPVTSLKRLAGRESEINIAFRTIQEPSGHLIIFGPRGIGKTSLIFVLCEAIKHAWKEPHAEGKVIYHGCRRRDTFADLAAIVLSRVFEDGPRGLSDSSFKSYSAEKNPPISDNPPYLFSPGRLAKLLKDQRLLIIFDDFDHIRSADDRNLVAQLMKILTNSESTQSVTLLISGIGDAAKDLLGYHESLDRCLVSIYLRNLNRSACSYVLNSAAVSVGHTMSEGAAWKITAMSEGLPAYLQLLGQRSMWHSEREGSESITELHYREAVLDLAGELKVDWQRQLDHVESLGMGLSRETAQAVLFCCALTERPHFTYQDARYAFYKWTTNRLKAPASPGTTLSQFESALKCFIDGPAPLLLSNESGRFRFHRESVRAMARIIATANEEFRVLYPELW